MMVSFRSRSVKRHLQRGKSGRNWSASRVGSDTGEEAHVPTRKTTVGTGHLTGFWNLLMCVMKGTVRRPAGTAAINKTPKSLLGTV